LQAEAGSAIEGAALLALFGPGTLPALPCFGLFASYFSGKTIHDLVRVSDLLVTMMASSGLMALNAA